MEANNHTQNQKNATAFKDLLHDEILAGNFAVARGLLVAAILMAKSENAPATVIQALVISYTKIFDEELQSMITKSQDSLALVGITQEYIRNVLALASGGNSGTAN